jgi:hypothetical protein
VVLLVRRLRTASPGRSLFDIFYDHYLSGEMTNLIVPSDFERSQPSPAWAPGLRAAPHGAAPKDAEKSPPLGGEQNKR